MSAPECAKSGTEPSRRESAVEAVRIWLGGLIFRLRHAGHYVFAPAHRSPAGYSGWLEVELWCVPCDETVRLR
jgi:hypothetical protein